ncbi:MAG: PriCT-2 domain-containing protein [Melioribacteraceae bacterium]|nr:PriCT-2 domain-containing protein [Melioribacteraceae bacterium]MCF8353915.1 PriCT-2 domain-containing protein [Melioribacteraceae bacterium]MCF8392672.1 PriCT-2 domain-containing protein [Melioribacteraceae bacterium]MCF8417693.1 PriCT-2 domain-containing protein [Melioribacteraceae bacterium]
MSYRDVAKDYNDAFGFNVIPLVNKIPIMDWSRWHVEEMRFDDIDKLGWHVRVNGLGTISGVNDLRCLDFDNVVDENFVYEFAEALGLGKDYVWIVKSGSGKGFHIWFYCENEDYYLEGIGGEKSYYKFEPRKNKKCDHVELRWKNCQTVLPPSKHPSGNEYKFVNMKSSGIPELEPGKVWIGKLLESIKKLCVIEDSNSDKKTVNSKSGSNNGRKRTLYKYEKKLLDDASDFIKGTIDNYDDWLKLGFALAEIGEAGREYFVRISSDNKKYNDCEESINKKFDGLLKDYRGDITLGTFFEIAKKYGWVKPRKHFWRIDDNKAVIIRAELIELLEEEGFGKIFIGDENIFVRVCNNVATETNNVRIKDFVLDYIDDVINEDWVKRLVKESLIKGARTIFGDATLECMQTLELHFLRDNKETSYFFFDNYFVEVNKGYVNVKGYDLLEGVIWERQKIDRKFVRGNSDCVFKEFLKNICRNESKRLSALKSAIGYLLHNYKNPACTKAIIFVDEKLSENAFGRSGKGLIGGAVSKLRNAVKIDGKNFNFDKSFAFQAVDIDTEIMFFDDVIKKFEFERLFSILTEGLTIEKKNRNSIHIDFEDSPKVLITTNYSVNGSDDSSKDRQFVVEFSDHYNARHKPTDDFGKLFFSEWDNDEFNRFDNFMTGCCQYYLQHGLVEYDYVNLTRKKLIDETSTEFEEFISGIVLGTEHNKKELFKRFQEEYEDYEKLRQNTFTKWTKVYANLYELDVHERKSGRERYFALTKKGERFIAQTESGRSDDELGF